MNSYTSLYSRKKEDISTYGGEYQGDDFELSEYGIQFGDFSVNEITPEQMIHLAKTIVDHLILNGHRFEIAKTEWQDQVFELKYLKKV
jgi:penicillin-binding protein-related factor A (putative recombinase)